MGWLRKLNFESIENLDILKRIRRFVSNEYSDVYDPTIEDRFKKTVVFQGSSAQLEIVDTAGKELVSEMLSRYISSADAFMVVYSVGSRKSYEHALYLFSQIARVRGVNSIARMLVAAKCDSDYREVSPEEGNTLSAQLRCSFAEASARSGINVHEGVHLYVHSVTHNGHHLTLRDSIEFRNSE
ncbi:hypothetical protein Y032_0165g23 [Ancylostoma ceylanicum]|uniref:Ras family protein n=1 Tax=Ancylostoma ceylanicum TaxID=53326 RepID=A0A016SX71_9BILA|nr:hypothetical protein Y032_0165g23 [Ancylostoma ceylanicum]